MVTTTVALTGHRPNKLWGYDLNHPAYRALQNHLEFLIEDGLKRSDVLRLHSGMALGADTIWAQAIVALKKRYPQRIVFVANVPFETQDSRWPDTSRQTYRSLLTQADEIVISGVVSARTSAPYLLNLRNEHMIEPADVLLALYDGSTTGGTANAIAYAHRKGKKVHVMPPASFDQQ